MQQEDLQNTVEDLETNKTEETEEIDNIDIKQEKIKGGRKNPEN